MEMDLFSNRITIQNTALNYEEVIWNTNIQYISTHITTKPVRQITLERTLIGLGLSVRVILFFLAVA